MDKQVITFLTHDEFEILITFANLAKVPVTELVREFIRQGLSLLDDESEVI